MWHQRRRRKDKTAGVRADLTRLQRGCRRHCELRELSRKLGLSLAIVMKTGRGSAGAGSAGRGSGGGGQAWPGAKLEVSKKKNKKSKGKPGISNGISVQERIAAELARRQRQGGGSGSALPAGVAAASPAARPEIVTIARGENDWAAAARAKRELKAVAKKNKRDPKALKKTTNKEKAAASEAAARLKEAQRAKKVAVAEAVAASRASRSAISSRDVVEGQGTAAAYGSRVRVLYVGKLLGSGATFDQNNNANKPLQFVVGGEEVIEGFEVGVVGMRVGGQRVIQIPPSMGYGDQPPPGVIPKNAPLQFTVTLLGFY